MGNSLLNRQRAHLYVRVSLSEYLTTNDGITIVRHRSAREAVRFFVFSHAHSVNMLIEQIIRRNVKVPFILPVIVRLMFVLENGSL